MEAQCETMIRPSYSPFQMGIPGRQRCEHSTTVVVTQVSDGLKMYCCDICIRKFQEANPGGDDFTYEVLPTWSCHVCKKVRPDPRISVHSRDITKHFGEGTLDAGTVMENVRYCNDDEKCTEQAKTLRLLGSKEA